MEYPYSKSNGYLGNHISLDSDQHSLRHSVLIKWNWTQKHLE
jgi:hypothetical protein